MEEEELLDHRKASNYELERPLMAQTVTEANTIFKEFLETKKQPRESQERGGRASARENLFKLRFKTPVKTEGVAGEDEEAQKESEPSKEEVIKLSLRFPSTTSNPIIPDLTSEVISPNLQETVTTTSSSPVSVVEEAVILPDVEEMRENWLKRKEEQHRQHHELFPIQPDSVSHIERAQAPEIRAEPVEDQISSVTVTLLILMILDEF
jgi:hypothetical protein